MFRYIYLAVDELEQELIDDSKKQVLNYEQQSNDMRLNYLFDRIWYMDTCDRLKQLSADKIQDFTSSKSKWNEPTRQILSIISRVAAQKDMDSVDVSTYHNR